MEFIRDGEKVRLDLFLCEKLPERSRTYIQKLIDNNWVQVSDLPLSQEIKPSTMIARGIKVHVTFPPNKKSELKPENLHLEILYEDKDLAVVNKPAGLMMHPSAHQFHGTLVNGLLYHLKNLSGIGGEERPGIVHRLDRYTSGVVVVAKNDLAHQALSQQFKDRVIKKTYVAVLRGQWTAREGFIQLPIGRSVINRKRMMVRVDGQGKEAVTSYKIIEEFDGYAFAEIKPLTGRTHQIRVHMSKIRLPVACDGIYGREQKITLRHLEGKQPHSSEQPIIQRQALHARRIHFQHPSNNQEVEFEVDVPMDMHNLLETLRKCRSLAD